MDWLIENAHDIFAFLGALGVAARVAVALTPSKHDDAFLAKAFQFFAIFWRAKK